MSVSPRIHRLIFVFSTALHCNVSMMLMWLTYFFVVYTVGRNKLLRVSTRYGSIMYDSITLGYAEDNLNSKLSLWPEGFSNET